MAERRMFAKTIIDSDAFLDMPLTTQALYFHLSMRADDDGFINNPKKIVRMVGCSEDDLKLLMAKSFIITFDTGIVVIKHWKIHNYIQSDRYKPTVYEEEKKQLEVKVNKAYTMRKESMDTECIHDVYTTDAQVSLGKNSIGKSSLELELGKVIVEEDDHSQHLHPLPELNEAHIKMIIELWNQQKVTQNIQDIRPMTTRYTNTRICINGDMKQFINAISTLDGQAFFQANARTGNTLKYDWFIKPQNYQKVIEGNYTAEYKEVVPETDGYEIKW